MRKGHTEVKFMLNLKLYEIRNAYKANIYYRVLELE